MANWRQALSTGLSAPGVGMALGGTALSWLAGRGKRVPRYRRTPSPYETALRTRTSALMSGGLVGDQPGVLGELRKRGRESIMAQRSRMSAGGAARQSVLLEGDIARRRAALTEANRREGTRLASMLAGREDVEAGREYRSELAEAERESGRSDALAALFGKIGATGIEQYMAGPAEREGQALMLAQLLGMEGVQENEPLEQFLSDWLERENLGFNPGGE